MRKERTLFVIGLWVIVLQFTGFPSSWKLILYLVTGVSLLYLAYLYYNQAKINALKNEEGSKAFVDNIADSQ